MTAKSARVRKTTTYDPCAHGALCSLCSLNHKTPVPPSFPKGAVFAVVGEAPGGNEVRLGRGFVGASGVLLDRLLRAAKIERSQILISNVILCRPEHNDLARLRARIRQENTAEKRLAKTEKREPLLTLDPVLCCAPRLYGEIAALWLDARAKKLRRPSIVPTGNTSLEALTGKSGVLKRQGSMIKATLPWLKRRLDSISKLATTARQFSIPLSSTEITASGQGQASSFLNEEIPF